MKESQKTVMPNDSPSPGRAEDLRDVLPDLMYTAVLPILGPEAAERELERGQRRTSTDGP